MILLYLALIVYCTIVYGIHGGEMDPNTNRQLRNLLCALPFGIVCAAVFGIPLGLVFFGLAYGGTSLGFDALTGYWGLAIKGFITYPLGGFATLPLTYFIGNRSPEKNVLSEYASGAAYGLLLVLTIILKGVHHG